jgi:hypothetical protein
MNKLIVLVLTIFGLVIISRSVFAQKTELKILKVELINDGKDISISISQKGQDSLLINDILLLSNTNQVGTIFQNFNNSPKPHKMNRKIVGHILSNQNLAWQPADLKISYSSKQTTSNTYYSVRKLKYKKPIEERKSYLSFSSGGMKFFGHKNNMYDNALSESPIAMNSEMEFGTKIFKKTYLTFNFNEQEITKSYEYKNGNTLIVYGDNWQFSSMMLGVKHELVFGKKLILGQIQGGYCNSLPYYRYPYDSLCETDQTNRPRSTSFIYGIELGCGYTLNYSTRFIIKSKLIHTNMTTNQISQSITGLGVNCGLYFYFNNKKG